jgi:hypothetical protein
MDEEIIDVCAYELGISYDAAEKFLADESGCYARVDGESIWISGQLIARLMKAAAEA